MNTNQTMLNPSSRNEISLWSALRLLLGKAYLLALAGSVCALLVFLFVSQLVTPRYESRVSFYVYNSTDGAVKTGTINNNDLQAAESLATTYSKILGSNSVLDAILDDLNTSPEFTRKELSKMVKASVVSGTQLLEVVVSSSDPAFARDIANAFAKIAPIEIVRITKAGGVEVVDRPELATEKSSPRTLFDTAVGFIVGVIIISVILVLRTLSDTTIYLPEDLEKLNGVAVLGQIPTIEATGSAIAWKILEGGAD